MGIDPNINQLSDAIKELAQQLKALSYVSEALHQASREETEKLEMYRANRTPLEFTLITGGLIEGEIGWIANQSIMVRTVSSQEVILYKHAIAFIQEQ